MKIITKKQYERLIQKEIYPYQEEIDELNRIISNKEYEYLGKYTELEDENYKLKQDITKLEEIILQRENEIAKLQLEKRKINGAKGGLTKYLNKIEQQLEEANDKLSKRYIVKEICPEKSRNTQVAKIKSGSITSRIIKQVVDK